MTTMTKSTFAKTKAQIKSYQYYLFWGACTFALMAGQIYVGTGYRKMSNSLDILVKTYINRPKIMPADKPLYEMPIIR